MLNKLITYDIKGLRKWFNANKIPLNVAKRNPSSSDLRPKKIVFKFKIGLNRKRLFSENSTIFKEVKI